MTCEKCKKAADEIEALQLIIKENGRTAARLLHSLTAEHRHLVDSATALLGWIDHGGTKMELALAKAKVRATLAQAKP